jgi:parallel beta-helix repeat protein
VKKYFASLLASHLASEQKPNRPSVRLKTPPRIEAVEPRLLYSADLAPVSLVAVTDQAATNPPITVAQQVMQATPLQANTTELVVLDARVADPTALLTDISAQQNAGRAIHLLEIADTDDAVLSIQNTLANLHQQGIDVSAIHIVSHGRDGEFDLGNATINDSFLKTNAQAFATWSTALSAEADILVYGCNFAKTSVGQSFARNLSTLTGADVAGNLQASGSTAFGGDWSLEFSTGAIESRIIFTQAAQTNWNHLLATGVSIPAYAHSLATPNDMNTGTLVDVGLNRTGGRAVAMDQAGNYVVAWTDSTSKTVYFTRYAANGLPLSVPQQVSTTSNQKTPAIAMASDGSFVLVWSEQLSGNSAIYGQRFFADGSLNSTKFLVASSNSYDCLQPNVAMNDNHDFVVVWQRINGAQLENIYSRSYSWASFAGQPISTSAELLIASAPDGTITGVEARPTVALNNTRVYLAWEGQDSSSSGIFLRSYNLNGTNASAVVQVNVNEPSQQSAPDIAVAPDGRVIVAWQTDVALVNADTTSYRIFEQSTSGPLTFIPITGELATNPSPGHNQSLPKVSVANSGDFLIAYQVENQTISRGDGSSALDGNWGVFFKGFDRNGAQTIAETSITDLGALTAFTDLNQYAANIAWRGSTAVFAWTTEGVLSHTGNVVSRQFQVIDPQVRVTLPPTTALSIGGISRPIQISLSAQPTANVTLRVSASNAFGDVDLGLITFTSGNWNIPVTVMVTAVNQPIRDPQELFDVQIEILPSSALEYRSIGPTLISFTNSNANVTSINVTTESDVADAPVGSTLTDLINYSGADGRISLREALLAANITPNLNAFTPDLINFSIPGLAGSTHLISILSSLPPITDRVTINGSSQSGATPLQPRIIIDGNGGNYDGFTLLSSGNGLGASESTNIQGLGIQNFGLHGINILSSNNFISDNVITQIGQAGVHLWSPSNNLANSNRIENNVISYAGYAGIHIDGADDNYIIGNVVGRNTIDGLLISEAVGGGAVNNTIQSNKIGGNGKNGVLISGPLTAQNKLFNNQIGFDQNVAALPNGYNGVLIQNGASNNDVGSTTPNTGNTIAYNSQVGVRITGADLAGTNSVNNRILGNSIFANGSLGIDLTAFDADLGYIPIATHNPNDPNDPFFGPNGSINSPVIVSATTAAGTTRITAAISAAPNAYYHIEYFSSPGPNATGFGDGATYLDSFNTRADVFGNVSVDFPSPLTVPLGHIVSATLTRATDATYSTLYGTSEFSNAVRVQAPPHFLNGYGTATVDENAPPRQIDFKQLLEDPLATGLTFSLNPLGNDNGYFSLDPTTGLLTISSTNYEDLLSDPGGPRDNNRAVTVIASIAGLSTSMNFSILYNDINEAIRITAPLTAAGTEDTAFSFSGLNNITLTDPDEGTTPTTVPNAPLRIITPVNFAITAKLTDGTASGQFLFNNLPMALAAKVTPTFLTSELRISGSLIDVNQALTYLEYVPALNSNAAINLRYTVDDQGSGTPFGGVTSDAKTTALTIAPVNDPTVLTFPTSLVTISMGDSYQLGNVLAPTLMLSDVDADSSNMQLIINAPLGSISVPLSPNISVLTANADTPQLVIEGTLANLQTALNSVVFSATSGTRGLVPIAIKIVDFNSGPLAIYSKDLPIYVSSPPTIADGDYSFTVLEGMTASTSIFSQATISDFDAGIITALRFHYPVPFSADEHFELPSLPGTFLPPTIDAINGIVQINGAATIAEYQGYVRQLTYLNTASNPTASPRTFSIEVSDGTHWSNLATTSIYVTSVNSTPSISVPLNMQVAFGREINLAAQALATPLAIFDNDAGTTTLRLDVSVNSGLLRFDNTQGISVVGNTAGSNSLKITGTLAQLNIALNQLYYRSNVGFQGNDTLSIAVDDFGGKNLPAGLSVGTATSTISALAGVPPILTIGSGTLTFVENNGAILALPTVTISGTNTGIIESATVSVVGGYDPIYDRLSGAGLWNGLTGQLSISGPLSVADFQKLLQKITFDNTSDTPATGKREILIDLFDGLQHSVVESSFVEVIATNDAPTLNVIATTSTREDTPLNLSTFKALQVADVDSAELVLQIQVSNGNFSWVGTTSKPTNIEIASTGLVTLIGSAQDVNSWASQLAFVPNANFNGVADVKWLLSDREPTPLSVVRQSTITVAAINDIPTWSSNTLLTVQQAQKVTITNANTGVIDVEDNANQLSYKIISMPKHGQLLISGRAIAASDTFYQSDVDAGLLEYRNDAGSALNDELSFDVTDSAGASAGIKTIAISITLTPVVVVTPPSGTSSTRDTTSTSGTSLEAALLSVKTAGPSFDSDPSSALNAGATAAAANATANSQKSQSSQSSQSSSAKATQTNGQPISGTGTFLSSVLVNGTVTNTASQSIGIANDKFGAANAAQKEVQTLRQDHLSNASILRSRTDTENTQYSGIIRAALTDKSFFDDVQKNRDESNKIVKFDRNIVASTTVVSASLSIGYVIWLVRGGALMSSLLASVPAWRLMDPLPILGSMGDNDQDNENDGDESLDGMIEAAKAKKIAAQTSLNLA